MPPHEMLRYQVGSVWDQGYCGHYCETIQVSGENLQMIQPKQQNKDFLEKEHSKRVHDDTESFALMHIVYEARIDMRRCWMSQ